MDWDEAKQRLGAATRLGEPLDGLSIRELEERAAALAAEIARTEAEIAKKRAYEAAASSIFKR